MIKFFEKRALLAHVQIRTEKHGEDVEPASTLKFEIEAANYILDEIEAGMRETFYTTGKDPQAGLDMEEGWSPDLRFPQFGRIPLVLDEEGYRIRITGTKPRANVVLEACEVKKVGIRMLDGGTVVVDLSANCHPDAGDISKLYRMNGGLCELTVEPPEDQQDQDALDLGEEGEDPEDG